MCTLIPPPVFVFGLKTRRWEKIFFITFPRKFKSNAKINFINYISENALDRACGWTNIEIPPPPYTNRVQLWSESDLIEQNIYALQTHELEMLDKMWIKILKSDKFILCWTQVNWKHCPRSSLATGQFWNKYVLLLCAFYFQNAECTITWKKIYLSMYLQCVPLNVIFVTKKGLKQTYTF